MKYKLSDVFCYLIIFLVGVFYISTLCPGHNWGDDFSAYINGAKNIVEGKSYTLTGFIVNPSRQIGPGSYPPLTSLCLAPLYAVFGMNISVFQLTGIFFFLLFLIIFWRFIRGGFSDVYAIVLLIFVAMNPVFWSFKNNVLSEYYFMFFLYLAILGIERHKDRYASQNSWGWGATIGFLLCLVYNTRTLGLVLFVAFILYEILVRRSVSFLLKVIFVFLVCELTQRFIFHFDVFSYFDMPSNYSSSHSRNLSTQFNFLKDFLSTGYSNLSKELFAYFFLLMAVWGYIARIRDRKQITVCEIFCILYFISLAYGTAMSRYLFPLFPLIAYYVFYGIKSLPVRSLLVFIICIEIILVGYIVRYVYKTNYKCGAPSNFSDYQTLNFFSFIRESTSPNDVIIFFKPRALYLATGRRSAVAHSPKKHQDLLQYFDQVGATYVVLRIAKEDYLKKIINKHKKKFSEVYKDKYFILYKLHKEFPNKGG